MFFMIYFCLFNTYEKFIKEYIFTDVLFVELLIFLFKTFYSYNTIVLIVL